MNKPLLATLSLAAGILIGTAVYSNVFDPMDMLKSSNILAANSYMLGCTEAKAQANKDGYVYTYEKNYCEYKAKQLYDKLEVLRKSSSTSIGNK